MKILIDLPTASDRLYPDLHRHLAESLGVGGENPFRLPVTIERIDSTEHAGNYTVITSDHVSDGESWSLFAALTFRLKPFQFPPRPVTPPDATADQIEHVETAWHEMVDAQNENEHAAIFKALSDAGFHIQSASSGRHYAGAPDVRLYGTHITVHQSGGLDC
jgi:hypothetical protein